MNVKKLQKVSGYQYDLFKIILIPVGGLLFWLVANWVFEFESDLESQLFRFGMLLNALYLLTHPNSVFRLISHDETITITVDEVNKQSVRNWKTTESGVSTFGPFLASFAGLTFALAVATYFYNNTVMGLDTQRLVVAMFAQVNFPEQMTYDEVVDAAFKAALLIMSATVPAYIDRSRIRTRTVIQTFQQQQATDQ